jgi:hypothetical protein
MTDAGGLTLGAFVEHGEGEYDTTHRLPTP